MHEYVYYSIYNLLDAGLRIRTFWVRIRISRGMDPGQIRTDLQPPVLVGRRGGSLESDPEPEPDSPNQEAGVKSIAEIYMYHRTYIRW